jgi:hypothetical protein
MIGRKEKTSLNKEQVEEAMKDKTGAALFFLIIAEAFKECEKNCPAKR